MPQYLQDNIPVLGYPRYNIFSTSDEGSYLGKEREALLISIIKTVQDSTGQPELFLLAAPLHHHPPSLHQVTKTSTLFPGYCLIITMQVKHVPLIITMQVKNILIITMQDKNILFLITIQVKNIINNSFYILFLVPGPQPLFYEYPWYRNYRPHDQLYHKYKLLDLYYLLIIYHDYLTQCLSIKPDMIPWFLTDYG